MANRTLITVTPLGFEPALLAFRTMPKKAQIAIKYAIIDTVEYTAPRVIRSITNAYAITRKSLLDQTHAAKFQLIKIKPKQEGGELRGGIITRSTRFPEMRFTVDPKQPPSQAGVPVINRKNISVSTIKGTYHIGSRNMFLAKMASGHIGVFRRKDPKRKARTGNWAIEERFMISPSEMIRGHRIRGYLQTVMDTRFAERLNYQIKRQLLHP